MTAWFLYATLLAASLSIASLAAERIARVLGRQARVLWIGSILLTVALPVVAYGVRAFASGARERTFASPLAPIIITGWQVTDSAHVGTSLQRLLIGGWVLLSLGLLARLATSWRRLHHTTRECRPRNVDGVPVLVSESLGPAVFGVREPRIIVPSWVLDLDDSLRSLVLRHEQEHQLARDPLALVCSAALCALLPWNIPLWWQAARLRRAIEMDCDARVLRTHPEHERYGLLLLAIAQRSTGGHQLSPALTEPRSLLTQRIHAMTSFPRRQPAAVAALALVAAGAVLFACSTPAPDSTAPLGDRKATPAVAAGPAPTLVSADQPLKEFQVEERVTLAPGARSPRYPDALRDAKIEGEVLAQFVVDKDGTPMVPTFKVLKSTDPLFTQAVRESLGNLRFTPALVGGRPVRQLLEMPFSFRLSKDAAKAPRAELGPARRPQ